MVLIIDLPYVIYISVNIHVSMSVQNSPINKGCYRINNDKMVHLNIGCYQINYIFRVLSNKQ